MARLFVAASSDYVDMGTGVRGDDLVGILVAAWIKMTSIPGGGHVVAAKFDASTNAQWILFVDGSGKLEWVILDSSFSGHGVTGSTTLSTGVWYHVAGLFVASGVQRCYVNGAQDATASPGVSLNHNSTESLNTYIGRQGAGGYFDGTIAEGMIGLVNTGLSTVAQYEATIAMMAAGVSPVQAWMIPAAASEFIRYFPLLGDSPEPEMAGHPGHNATVHGTTVVPHPPSRTVTFGTWGGNP